MVSVVVCCFHFFFRTRFNSNCLASREQVLGVMLDLEKVYLNQAKISQGERLALKEIAN